MSVVLGRWDLCPRSGVLTVSRAGGSGGRVGGAGSLVWLCLVPPDPFTLDTPIQQDEPIQII